MPPEVTKKPMDVALNGMKITLIDGVADANDPLFNDGSKLPSGLAKADFDFVKDQDLYRNSAANNLATNGRHNPLTHQFAFQFLFSQDDDDLSEVLRAWAILKPLLRRTPALKRLPPEVRDGIVIRIFEPGLDKPEINQAVYVEGEGWFLKSAYADKFLSDDDLVAFEMLRKQFGWRMDEEDDE